jgi:hypothetical protein
MSAWAWFILWIVSTVIVVTAIMVLWFNWQAPNKPPRNFKVVVKWEGHGYWPSDKVRPLRWTFAGGEAFLVAVGVVATVWSHSWVVGAIMPLIGVTMAYMVIFPQKIGGKVYANETELFFHNTPRILALSAFIYRFRWRNVVEWTEHEGYIDVLYEGGGLRIRLYMPPIPAEIQPQVEGWRLGAQRA